MVSLAVTQNDTQLQLTAGLSADDSARLMSVMEFVKPVYSGKTVVTGQDAYAFSQGVVMVLSSMKTDADTRVADRRHRCIRDETQHREVARPAAEIANQHVGGTGE